jgi:filamentous hemagglutinin family protein
MGASALSFLLLFGQSAPLLANPTGGAVVAGAATIGAAGKTLSITQSTQNAIINWKTFSIASGETTKFLVPNSSSATLNYVLSGNPSAIYGTLSSNGRLFLVNPSGILVGPSGRIDTASFIGSTLNANNSEFLSGGNLQFSGSSTASVVNEGSISASSGNVYLIANQVSNEGSITAPQGEVGLAAGSNVLLAQDGDQHLFVQSNPLGTTRAVGVNNAGTISAASAELRAAGGNAYALAINNSGSIAATGYKKVGGQVYLTAGSGDVTNSGKIRATGSAQGGSVTLTSKGGTVSNSGTIDASATGSGGVGGSVLVSSTGGEADNTGLIESEGGTGGNGGDVDVSGETVDITGGFVDTLSVGGKAGTFTIDPNSWIVAPTGGNETGAQVDADLTGGNVDLQGVSNVTISDDITWTNANTLTITTINPGSSVTINNPISGVNGGLVIDTAGASDAVTATANGSVNVASFELQDGAWSQNSATLPSFSATSDFVIGSSATFLRVTGGDGTAGNPYQIVDIYGLEGLASKPYLTSSAVLENNIDATMTANWNSGKGWMPIGSWDGVNSSDSNAYSGTFDGQDFTINGLTINNTSLSSTGLFGDTASAATVENVNLTAVSITGNEYAGGLTGVSNATVVNSSSAGTVSGNFYIGGLLGINGGIVDESSSAGTVRGNSGGGEIGGLVGESQYGNILDCSSSANVLAGAANSTAFVGGLVGLNLASIGDSSSSGTVTGQDIVGGLVGYNEGGTVANSNSSSPVTGGLDVGGLVGQNTGTVTQSYATGAINGDSSIGGLVGTNNGGTITQSYSVGSVNGLNEVGGLVGANVSGGISDSFSTGTVTGTDDMVGGFVGYNQSGSVVDSYTISPVMGSATSEVGGFVGFDNGGSYTNVFWDTNTGNVSVGSGNTSNIPTGIFGATTSDLMSESYILSNTNGSPAWDFSETWSTNGGTTLPELPAVGGPGAVINTVGDTLSGIVYTNASESLTADDVTIYLILDGVATGTTTTSGSGAYSFTDLSASDISGGVLLTDPLDKGNTYFLSGSSATSFTSINIDGGTLTINADTASNSALRTAAGGLAGYGINYAVDGSNNLTTNTGVGMNIISGMYTVDGNITTPCPLAVSSNASLRGSVNATLQGSAINMSGYLNDSGVLTFTSTSGAVDFESVGNSESAAQSGGLTVNAAGPAIFNNCDIAISGGNFMVSGTGYTSTSDTNGDPNGVDLYDTTVTLDGGNFCLNGTAGYISPGEGVLESGFGVAIGTDGNTLTELTTTGSGNGTITGNANQSITSETAVEGVSIYNLSPSGTTENYVAVADGLLTINGTVNHTIADGTDSNAASIGGVQVQTDCEVLATGSGSVAITGDTSGATTEINGGNFSFISGVEISGLVGVGSGSLTITGTAGTLNTTNSTINSGSEDGGLPASVGVAIDCPTFNPAENLLSGPGSVVTITGTGGSVMTNGAYTGDSTGVSFSDSTQADFGTAPSAPPTPGLVEEEDVVSQDTESSSGSQVTINGTGGMVNAGNGANAPDAASTGVDLTNTSITVEDGGCLAVTGTGGTLNAGSATAQTGDNFAISQGIRISNDTVIAAEGSSGLCLNGSGGTATGGADQAVGSTGLNIGNDKSKEVSITTQSGCLTIIGQAGSSPNLGVGVVVHALSGGLVNITSGSTLTITGTGGTGYTGNGTISGNSVPNAGVILAGDNTVTGETVTITGTGGAHSDGVMIVNLTGDGALDNSPVSGSFSANDLTITSLSGGVVVDAGINTSDQLTITSPTTLSLLGTGGTSITTENLSATAHGLLTVDTSVAGEGTMNIFSTTGNVVLGPNASINDDGTNEEEAPNVLTIAAGTQPGSTGYFINGSSLAGTSVTATDGAVYYIFSTSPAGDQYNGLTVDPNNVVFNATFPETTLPSGNGELYYATTGSIPVNLLELAEEDDGSGSDLVPVSVVPQQGDVNSSGAQPGSNGPTTPSLGNGNSNGPGGNSGGLANASGNGGLIVSGDLGQLSGGQLNNVQGALVNGAFTVALGADTYLNLSAALGLMNGGYYPNDATDTTGDGHGKGKDGGSNKAVIQPGQCFEISGGTVILVPNGQTPNQIKNALNNNVLNNMPGH